MTGVGELRSHSVINVVVKLENRLESVLDLSDAMVLVILGEKFDILFVREIRYPLSSLCRYLRSLTACHKAVFDRLS